MAVGYKAFCKNWGKGSNKSQSDVVDAYRHIRDDKETRDRKLVRDKLYFLYENYKDWLDESGEIIQPKHHEDLEVVEWYIRKVEQCNNRGMPFELSIISFKNICKAKKCYFTGLPVDSKTKTIDRVDASKGYVPGNVVCCHKMFNSLKGIIEDDSNPLTFKNVLRGINKTTKRL